MMASVFLTLQGKGGIGKSFVSSTLAQYLLDQGGTVHCIDTDPNNSTFSAYRGLTVEKLDITEGAAINPRTFDQLIQMIVDSEKGAYFVVDNGSPSFIPMMSYLVENDVLGLLNDRGHRVVINTVIAGGPDVTETLSCFDEMMAHTEADALVWFNAYFGALRQDGKDVEQFVIERYGERLFGTVVLQKLMEQTFGRDVREMLEQRFTFDEAIQSFDMMPATRIKRVKRELWDALSLIFEEPVDRGKRRAKKESS